MRMAWSIARRELRGGIGGFRVFLLCLMLGVAAIAAIGTVRAAIDRGLTEQGAALLGGDAEMSFSYRLASEAERAFMAEIAEQVSETVDLRSMAGAGEERVLTQLRAVDDGWPLIGQAVLDPPIPVDEALAVTDLPGAVMDPGLAARLGIEVGDTFTLGEREFRLTARLMREPDTASGGFQLAPRTVTSLRGLEGSGLLAPGTVFDSDYRLKLAAGADLDALRARAQTQFRDAGLRWRDSRRPSPSVERFVDRTGAFLVLVGLAGLAVGGIGVQAAVGAYLARKTATIATLRTLGAEGRLILASYGIQIGLLAVLGVAAGLILGTALPLMAAPWVVPLLPFPIAFGVAPQALAEAAFYGLMTAALFTLWPLARTARLRAAALYRGAEGGVPRRAALALVVLAAVLVGGAVWLSGMPGLALGAAAVLVAAMLLLAAAARGVEALARRMARRARGPSLRMALAGLGAGSETRPVILSLGLGLSVLAAIGQIDTNLRTAIERDLPERAPSYFFVDIQPDQLDGFLARVEGDPQVERVDHAPMLRGVLTRINGRPAREVAGDHWVLRGDRGVTYADTAPDVVEGTSWPAGDTGPPQISFAAEEAREMGLSLGDKITVNILGRDIEAELTSLRDVDFSDAGMGFVMMMNPQALAGAPHTSIATVYSPGRDDALLRDLGRDFPNVTAIAVGDAIARVAEALNSVATATRAAAAITLLTGIVVLLGTTAAGTGARVREAAVLKVLGATRARILAGFVLRSALMGAVGGLIAVAAGAAAGWAVMTFVMHSSYAFAPGSAAVIVAGGVAATLAAGALFVWAPLSARPARVLRGGD
ncbi:ABC transporter permease [Falsirhodobacter algicola]|uniref:FtsX-like permease family protein n=1 Tax=Falsirhodobacter algicola TaxID=2692330 RepID=A0A8J8MUQ7_9RHOB|nr:FtsX-like permease family protein [Falsirhodobacter algicola]QUS37040.1 FtsX-like permease family protein [Falsirhodobacter algicola]